MVNDIKPQISQVFLPFNIWLDQNAEALVKGENIDLNDIFYDIRPDIFSDGSQEKLFKLFCNKNE